MRNNSKYGGRAYQKVSVISLQMLRPNMVLCGCEVLVKWSIVALALDIHWDRWTYPLGPPIPVDTSKAEFPSQYTPEMK